MDVMTYVIILLRLATCIAGFAGLWFSSIIIIKGIENISKNTQVSSFTSSFFILGILTSIPEISIGITSVLNKVPEIYVGNLIGGSFVLFVLLIPLLAILGNGISLNHKLSPRVLLFSLFVISVPALLTIDGNVGKKEALVMLFLYAFLLIFFESRISSPYKHVLVFIQSLYRNISHVGKIIFAAGVIYLSSRALVEQSVYLSIILHIHPYLLSIIFLAIGSNLPELTLGIRSVLAKKTDIALGDYIGSASANTLIFGILTLINGSFSMENGFLNTYALLLFGLLLFYLFSRSKNDISRSEGFILLGIYLLFIAFELFY